MREITLICDDCKRKSNVRPYMVQMGEDPDPSGNGYVWDWQNKDWCLKCLLWFARQNKDTEIRDGNEPI